MQDSTFIQFTPRDGHQLPRERAFERERHVGASADRCSSETETGIHARRSGPHEDQRLPLRPTGETNLSIEVIVAWFRRLADRDRGRSHWCRRTPWDTIRQAPITGHLSLTSSACQLVSSAVVGFRPIGMLTWHHTHNEPNAAGRLWISAQIVSGSLGGNASKGVLLQEHLA